MAGPSGTRPPRLRFHAVTVVPCADACAQALSLGNVRLLSVEAPRLPMAGCDRPHDCDCRFKHHDDRRAGPRRRGHPAGATEPATRLDRRLLRGRRTTDWPED
jgi:hypothetical protein